MYNINQSSSYQPTFTGASYTNSVTLNSGLASMMTKSRILEHNKYAKNDPLYSPLRNVVSSDPAFINSKQNQHINAMKSSQVTHEYHPLTVQQFQNIRDNTYMIQKPLKATDRIEKIQGKQFVILDSDEKMGTPINEIQFRSRLAASREKHIVVYEPQDSPSPLSPKKNRVNSNINIQPYQSTPLVPIVQRPRKVSKYNLYSCLDEPFQRIKRVGCQGMTCPANECVAARNQKEWFD